jgi:hypothetical protein
MRAHEGIMVWRLCRANVGSVAMLRNEAVNLAMERKAVRGLGPRASSSHHAQTLSRLISLHAHMVT